MDFNGHYKRAVSNITADLFLEEQASQRMFYVFQG